MATTRKPAEEMLVTVKFGHDKDAKNSKRFGAPIGDAGREDVFGSVYVTNSQLSAWGNPDTLEVTVRPAE